MLLTRSTMSLVRVTRNADEDDIFASATRVNAARKTPKQHMSWHTLPASCRCRFFATWGVFYIERGQLIVYNVELHHTGPDCRRRRAGRT